MENGEWKVRGGLVEVIEHEIGECQSIGLQVVGLEAEVL